MDGIGRRERKKRGTHEALLSAATRLFAERGIYVTTIEEITEAADLGKGTFYKHFAGRDEILAAVLRQGFSLLGERLRAEALPGGGTGPLLRDLLAVHARFFAQHPGYLLLFHQARGWLKLPGQQADPVRDEFRAYVDGLADLLGSTPSGRQRPADELRREARVLAGIVSGTLSYEVIAGDGGIAAMERTLAGDLARLGTALEPATVPGTTAPSPRPR